MQLLKPGATFAAGRYEVVRMISAGGMGVVYEVLHKDTRRKRALKVMLPQVALDDDLRARFSREGIVTAGIESEHLVEVFDIGIDEETQSPFLVMELLRGEDLGARLERGERTRPAELVSIFEQVARALDKTHEAGVIHRDLKPENLFVTRRDDGSLKMRILDFGIAKLMEGRGAKKSTRSVGTPLYMAPEQMTGDAEELGPAADIYALAHIAFTMLVGSAYFEPEARTAASALGLMAKVCSGASDPASKRAAALGLELSPKFDAWFAKATALQPSTRFATAGQLCAALRDALAGAPEELAPASVASRPAAFAETLPVAAASPAASTFSNGAAARSAAASMPPSQPTITESGPVPSTRTVAERPTNPKRTAGVLVALGVAGAAAIFGIAYLTRAPAGQDESPRAGLDARPSEDLGAASPPPDAPNVTLAAPTAPAALIAPTAPAQTSSASTLATSASASPSATAAAGKAPPPPPRTAPAVPPPPPGVPTVWDGPRR